MRPVSRVSAKNKASQRPISPQVVRRRELRRRARQTLFIQVWRLVALLLLCGGLTWMLLRHGWTLRSPEAMVLRGDAFLETEQVIESAQLSFPQPLMDISPRALEQRLMRRLPLRSAQVHRQLLPARLVIHLKAAIPVARAERQGPAGRERGLLNAEGRWIPLSEGLPEPLTNIMVRGWNDQQRGQVAVLLRQLNRFEAMLKAIELHPNGDISLVTTELGRIDLGGEPALLNAQIEMIFHLKNSLPAYLREVNLKSLDLSNPDRPELQLPTPRAPKKVTAQP